MIFYFSATGNSKFTADKIANSISDKTVSIGNCVKSNNYDFDLKGQDFLGFVMPVYYWDVPSIVYEFLKRATFHNLSQNTYVFAIYTCGGEQGHTNSSLKKILNKKNIVLKSAYSIQFPDNCIMFFPCPNEETQKKILDSAEKQIEEITREIQTKTNIFMLEKSGKLPSSLFHSIHSYFVSFSKRTKKFHATDECINCGLCEDVCPNENIRIVSNKPMWCYNNCIKCLACVHRCPVHAIEYGKMTVGKGRYINPNCDFSKVFDFSKNEENTNEK